MISSQHCRLSFSKINGNDSFRMSHFQLNETRFFALITVIEIWLNPLAKYLTQFSDDLNSILKGTR